MKIDNYAVSVQYGEGHHFFVGYFESYATANLVAKKTQEIRKKAYKKGAKPRTHLWSYMTTYE